jgi:hypothetical protein
MEDIPLNFKKLAPKVTSNPNGIQYPPSILEKGK